MTIQEHPELEAFERMISRQGNDIAVAIARSFGRLEERIDAAEGRLSSRIAEVEDMIDACDQSMADEFEALRSNLRKNLATGQPVKKS